VSGWGTWEEDRRYPAGDGEHMIIVWKRTEDYGEPKIRWKNSRRKLTVAERAYLREQRRREETPAA
jgi:hypothetical protein